MRTSAASIAEAFARCAGERRAALIAFLTAGFPTLERTPALVRAACEGGADMIELGFAYSDPIADGPAIQRSSYHALEQGARFDQVLEAAARLHVSAPIIAFTYYNVLLARGLDRAAGDLAAAGFAGVIVPDLPVEEAGPLTQACRSRGLCVTFLVAPTTPPDRARRIAQRSDGFVYVVSTTGVTGVRSDLDTQLQARLAALRAVTGKPLAVGFGVSTPQQVAELARSADGIVVGSALMAAAAQPDGVAAVLDLCHSLHAASLHIQTESGFHMAKK